MRKLIGILILLPLFALSKSTILLDIHSCKDNSFGSTRILKVVKDGKLIYPLLDISSFYGGVWITDLDSGLYKIQYQNIFLKDVCDSIQISENRLYKIDICVDKFAKYDGSFQGLIDSISESKSLIIKTTTVHTNQVKTELRVVKEKGKSIVYLKQQFQIKGEKRPNISKSVILSETLIDRIRQFEYELNIVGNIDNMICSGRTHYSIELGETKKQYLDPTCEWAGIYNLIKDIFN